MARHQPVSEEREGRRPQARNQRRDRRPERRCFKPGDRVYGVGSLDSRSTIFLASVNDPEVSR